MSAPARTCQQCGAAITDEQIARKAAGLIKGVLLCPACVEAKRQAVLAHRAAQGTGAAAGRPGTAAGVGAVAGTEASAAHGEPGSTGGPKPDLLDEPISLVEADEPAGRPVTTIRSLATGGAFGASARGDDRFKRPLAEPGQGATRCRIFHSKLSDASVAHLDDQINEWLDAHSDVFVKHVATTVGVFEGKHSEPHLVVTIWY